MAVEAVLVDLDGTVWDSAPWFARLLAPQDRAERERLTTALRNPVGGLRAAALVSQHYSQARFAKACSDATADLSLYDSAAEVLHDLHRRVSLGVVSNLPAWIARPMLSGHRLENLFQTIQTARRGVPAKPHPAGVRRGVEALRVPPTDAVYVGDTRADLAAAAGAAVPFLWASWGYDQLDGVVGATSWMDVGALA